MRYTCVDTAEFLYPDITEYKSGTKEIKILSPRGSYACAQIHFSDVKEQLRGENLSYWKVKEMEWLDDCPVPEGEDFRKIAGV